ncbi:MAG: hypothetical protein JNM07_13090 [Phycisphaerae bacterium]|nr:hypothetical protein [Phycisphaerae bacterium]
MSDALDPRAELAATAAHTQRRNTPRHLLVAGAGVLLVGVAYAGLEWWGRGSALRQEEYERSQTEAVRQKSDAIRAIVKSGDAERFKRDLLIVSKLDDVVRKQLGVPAEKSSIQDAQPSSSSGRGELVRQTWKVEVNDQPAEVVLAVIRECLKVAPGMEVSQVRLNAGTSLETSVGWKLMLDVSRWERRN